MQTRASCNEANAHACYCARLTGERCAWCQKQGRVAPKNVCYCDSLGGPRCSVCVRTERKQQRAQQRAQQQETLEALQNVKTAQYEQLSAAKKDAIRKALKRCEVCNTDQRLCVDHCHDSGRVRGVLCSKCNFALGALRDNPKLINRLLTYAKAKVTPLKKKHTRTKKRPLYDCPACDGTGHRDGDESLGECPQCRGTGEETECEECTLILCGCADFYE